MGSLQMSIRGRVIRSALPVLLAPVALTVIFGGAFLGCAADGPAVHATPDGPPPDGFESWDDYWVATDADTRDFEHDAQIHRMKQPRVPGMP